MNRRSSKVQSVSTAAVTTKNHDTPAGEVTIGSVVDVDSLGIPWVDFPGNPNTRSLKALTTISIGKDSIGRQVALLFSGGNPENPVVIGLIKNILDQEPEKELLEADAADKAVHNEGFELDLSDVQAKHLVIDGERMAFTADKEIILKCGKASITLTRAGKILIRGTYLSNRSSGVNRIKGGSVQIN